jgi:hypothetical protein
MVDGMGAPRARHYEPAVANGAASTGASTRELMSRMGHSTARAALIYQHASADRDRLIADAVSGLVDKGLKKARKAKKKQDRKPKGHAGDMQS